MLISLDFVYYYMITRGRHPFKENFHRQVSTIFMVLSLSCVYYHMITRGRHPLGRTSTDR
jgi:hypothetical protein